MYLYLSNILYLILDRLCIYIYYICILYMYITTCIYYIYTFLLVGSSKGAKRPDLFNHDDIYIYIVTENVILFRMIHTRIMQKPIPRVHTSTPRPDPVGKTGSCPETPGQERVFLDVCCINQADNIDKGEGILSLMAHVSVGGRQMTTMGW